MDRVIGQRRPARGPIVGAWWLVVGAFLTTATARTAPVSAGATATRDYYAPEAFTVVDPVATVETLARAGESAPLVVRFDAELAASAVAQFEEAFARTRTAFLEQLESVFESREIGIREINSSRFRGFRNDFQAANPLFPVNIVLAQSWAKGYDGNPTRDRQAAALRRVLASRKIATLRPASTLFVVHLPADTRVRHWGEIASLARALDPREVVSTEEVGLEIRRQLDALDRVAGGFLSGLVQPNLVEEPHLTALLLHERLGERALHRRYRAGAAIARKGETLDNWSALAINHLLRAGVAPLPAPPFAPAPSLVEQPDETPAGPVGPPSPLRPLLLVGGGALVVVVAFLVAARRTRRRPARATEAIVPADAGEARSTKEALLPHLARALKDRLVHVLFAQRRALLENEEAATRRVAEMEERLARLQPAIAERVKEYEARIERLERELLEKDQETRDLIRAKLVLARKELDEEVARNRIRWN